MVGILARIATIRLMDHAEGATRAIWSNPLLRVRERRAMLVRWVP